jgi:glycerol-3-phosphate dehydrogenase
MDRYVLKRDVAELSREKFDLLIIGGGIFGACAAWDAALRGLSVALIERQDFGCGASANCYKVAHGGIRYLQHLDIARVRQSSNERSAFMRIAPHLVQPLPIAIPTYGYGRTGKFFLRSGCFVYDLLTLDRNRMISDPDRKTPNSWTMSRRDVLDAFPGVPSVGLTGAVVMHDGQFTNPPRLVFALVASAHSHGANVANYIEATGIKRLGHHDMMVSAVDGVSGETLEIRARSVLNTAGPWSEELINRGSSDGKIEKGVFSRDLCFVVPRRIHERLGLAVQAETSDPDALLGRPNRHLFLVPWRDYTLVGVWHRVYPDGPDRIRVEQREKEAFVREINSAYPDLALTVSEVKIWNSGLVPFGEEQSSGNDLRFGKRSRFVDHGANGGPAGLFTLIGVRYTMGRGDTEVAMKLVGEYLQHGSRSPATDRIPIIGGKFESFSDLISEVRTELPDGVDDRTIASVARNYGSSFHQLTDIGKDDLSALDVLPGSRVLRAEITSAARNEMCMTLGDIVFRRTDLASAGDPGDAALRGAAEIASQELGWSATEQEAQIADVRQMLPYGCSVTDVE